ncbi:hypothetical protein [Vitreimonas sp.]|uniref:hypothetical protein n=1 Tax=Vitreimonas sp. TaxID=3069702 RepID=UPI002EDA3AFE
MRGAILGVHGGRGVLMVDERRLEFPMSEWRSATPPVAGQIVDFIEENGEARAVFAVPGAYAGGATPARSYSGSFVLGAIGVGCLVLGFVIPLLPTIAAFVLGCIGASQAQAERDDTALLLSRIAWIGAVVLLSIGILAMLAVMALIGTIGFAAIFEGLGPHDW